MYPNPLSSAALRLELPAQRSAEIALDPHPVMTSGAREDDDRSDKHRDKEQEKRDTDGRRPINPDTVREPKPGKRGK